MNIPQGWQRSDGDPSVADSDQQVAFMLDLVRGARIALVAVVVDGEFHVAFNTTPRPCDETEEAARAVDAQVAVEVRAFLDHLHKHLRRMQATFGEVA